MSSEIEWSQTMSNEDFVAVSEKYFKRNRIDLHIACCLLAKVDPETKEQPVGEGFRNWDTEPDPQPYDYTRRPFIVALRAINGEHPQNPLVPAEPLPSDLNNAREIILSTRTFVAWAMQQWPDLVFIGLAEDHYQAKKAASPSGYLSKPKNPTQTKWGQRKLAFENLIDDLGEEVQGMSDRELARKLATHLKHTPYAAAAETLRKRFNRWRSGLG